MSLDQDLLAFNARLVRFMNRVDGRDKVIRAAAYGSDFLLWILTNAGKEKFKLLIHQVNKVKSGCGVARKLFRIGAPAKDVDAIANIKEGGPERMLRVVMHACNGVYYTIDTVELLTIFDILPYNTAKVKELRYRFWTVKTAILLLLTIWRLRRAFAAVRKARRELELAADSGRDLQANKDKHMWELGRAQAQLVSTLTDVPIAIFQISDFGRLHIGAGGAGFAGLIGSLVNAREVWLQTAAAK